MNRQRVWREQLVDVSGGQWRVNVTVQIQDCVWGVYRLLVSTRSITRCMLLYFPRSHSRHQRRALRRLCTHLLQHGCAKIRRESNNKKSRSSAAHMGNVQAWEWVSCVHLFTFTASVLPHSKLPQHLSFYSKKCFWLLHDSPYCFYLSLHSVRYSLVCCILY